MIADAKAAGGRLLPRLLAAGCLLGAAAAWPVVWAEHRSAAVEAGAIARLGGPAPLPWETPGSGPACDETCPPRAAAAHGVELADQAAPAADPATRARLSAAAEIELTRALAARPTAGEWWAWRAYARLLHGGEFDAARRDLQASYDNAPFLAHLAVWRIGTAARYWPRLPAGLRARAADEMAWLRDVDPDDARTTFAAIDDPSASEALSQALARPPAPSVPHRGRGGPGGIGFLR